MAISATVNKINLNIADMVRHYYQQHDLVVAVHPSENDHRFIVRIIAFALNAHEQLRFTKGLAAADEAELWQKSLSDEIDVWIDFGQVDEKRVRKACGRAKQVIIYTYHAGKAAAWWDRHKNAFARHDNLSIFHIDAVGAESLVSRNMELQCNIDEDSTSISTAEHHLNVDVTRYE